MAYFKVLGGSVINYPTQILLQSKMLTKEEPVYRRYTKKETVKNSTTDCFTGEPFLHLSWNNLRLSLWMFLLNLIASNMFPRMIPKYSTKHFLKNRHYELNLQISMCSISNESISSESFHLIFLWLIFYQMYYIYNYIL